MEAIAVLSSMVQVSTIAYVTATGDLPHWIRYVWAVWLFCWMFAVCTKAVKR